MILLILLILIFCFLTPILAEVTYEVRFLNQEIVGTDYFFDIYIKSTGDNLLYLADSDVYLDFNESNFNQPVASIVDKNSALFDYYGGSISINDCNQIVISITKPGFSTQNEFNLTIALLSQNDLGNYYARCKVTGVVDPDESVDLNLYYNEIKKSRGTDIHYCDAQSPWDAHQAECSDKNPAGVTLKTKIFLEGPYNAAANEMSTSLNSGGYIPLTSPYDEDPRTVSSIPANVTDWVLVQLRSTPDGYPVVSKSVFLRKDGFVVSDDGTSEQVALNVEEGNYYVVIHHRNHCTVMSSSLLALNNWNPTLYNFTIGSEQFYNGQYGGQVEIEMGAWGMWTGDGNMDGGVYGEDYTLYQLSQGDDGYQPADFNMDGGVYGEDYTFYHINQGEETQVP